MTALVARTWGGCAGLGTGLLLVGVGSGHLGHSTDAAAALLALAAGALVAAAGTLHGAADPRVAAVLLALTGAATVAVGAATHRFGTAELTTATLGLVGAVLLGWATHARTRARREGQVRPTSGRTAAARLVLLSLGAFAVAAATGGGLAATEAGDHAVPHGTHLEHGHG